LTLNTSLSSVTTAWPHQAALFFVCLGQAQIIPCLGVVRLNFQRLLEVANGFIHAPAFQQQRAQVVVDAGEARLDSEGLLEMSDGVRKVSLLKQSKPEVVLEIGVVGLSFQGSSEMNDGIL
jgi:hypothetical protein